MDETRASRFALDDSPMTAECGCRLTGLAAIYGRHTGLLVGHRADCHLIERLRSPSALCCCWHPMGYDCEIVGRHHPHKAADCAVGDNYSHSWRADGKGSSECEICGLANPQGRRGGDDG